MISSPDSVRRRPAGRSKPSTIARHPQNAAWLHIRVFPMEKTEVTPNPKSKRKKLNIVVVVERIIKKIKGGEK
jgi:hypothetical protein